MKYSDMRPGLIMSGLWILSVIALTIITSVVQMKTYSQPGILYNASESKADSALPRWHVSPTPTQVSGAHRRPLGTRVLLPPTFRARNPGIASHVAPRPQRTGHPDQSSPRVQQRPRSNPSVLNPNDSVPIVYSPTIDPSPVRSESPLPRSTGVQWSHYTRTPTTPPTSSPTCKFCEGIPETTPCTDVPTNSSKPVRN